MLLEDMSGPYKLVKATADTEFVMVLFWFVDQLAFYTMAEDVQFAVVELTSSLVVP